MASLGWKGLNFPAQKNVAFFGMERVKPFQPKKIVAFFGMERIKPFQLKKCSIFCDGKS
jgi:hypothetical protein